MVNLRRCETNIFFLQSQGLISLGKQIDTPRRICQSIKYNRDSETHEILRFLKDRHLPPVNAGHFVNIKDKKNCLCSLFFKSWWLQGRQRNENLFP